ncbi:MAG: GNAT family N-acetyltransferase [Candidatus Kapabacteria bacterium]|jgi:GNAT superfamily N-acetyltransferase|nr:GNAT family N-acetyltransferase [Candidatus Kapabacteria bacterium]
MMNDISFHVLQASDDALLRTIAQWYREEWNILESTTIIRLANLSGKTGEFQIVAMQGGKPIATGGVYNHVSLLDKEPRFTTHKHWLALVYSLPELRGKGMGAVICRHIEQHAQMLGVQELYLFTYTAERLYERLGWQALERLQAGEKDIVIMQKSCL